MNMKDYNKHWEEVEEGTRAVAVIKESYGDGFSLTAFKGIASRRELEGTTLVKLEGLLTKNKSQIRIVGESKALGKKVRVAREKMRRAREAYDKLKLELWEKGKEVE